MRSLASVALVAASAAASVLLVMLSRGGSPSLSSPLVGLYEPVGSAAAQQGRLSLEATFIDWNAPDLEGKVLQFLQLARQRRRLPLLTLEPFSDRAHGRPASALLGDVAEGRHDRALRHLARALAAHPGVVLLRFAHEMDQTGQYPWSVADPRDYLKLYRTAHGRIAAATPGNVRWVWSPAGNPAADRFWPGDGYVDLIGVSIYASRAWTPDHRLPSFAQLLEQKRWLAQRFDRPLIVAEVGVSGSELEQRRWLSAAITSLPRFPELCGLVYFQAPQPRWMPLPTGPEDWALRPAALQWLLRRLPLPARHARACVEG